MAMYVDLTGKRFGMLTVVRRDGVTSCKSGTMPKWAAKCDCGKETSVMGASLRYGRSKSCGCQLKKHGMFGTPEYSAWVSMLQRCNNPKRKNFHEYGGRGIKVCEQWKTFPVFLADMGKRPSSDHSLDRKDNNGNYGPANCRWATKKQQQRNRRVSHVLTVAGVSATIAEWAEETGVGTSTIRQRLMRGWTPEAAIKKV